MMEMTKTKELSFFFPSLASFQPGVHRNIYKINDKKTLICLF